MRIAGVSAQAPRFHHLTMDNGLSQNAVLSIVQDSEGFVWVGTEEGLNRYDGYQFKQFRHIKGDSGSLSDNYANTLFVDSRKRLWIGVDDALNLFHSDTETFSKIRFPASNKKKFYVEAIYEDKQNRLWISTNQGLFVSDVAKLIFKLVFSKEVTHILQIAADSFLLGTRQGLILFDYRNGKLDIQQQYQTSASPNAISSNAISDILQDNLGQIWVATENSGLNLFRPTTHDFLRLPVGGTNKGLAHNAVRKLIQRKSGEIWIGTQEGLSVLNPKTYTIENYRSNADANSLNHNSIYALYEDKAGSVWVGTYFGGLNVAYAHLSYFYQWRFSLSPSGINVLSSIVPDNDCYWVGSEGGGLKKVDLNGNTLQSFVHRSKDVNSLGSNLVKLVYRDNDANIWVGTHGGGINLLNKSSGTFQRIALPSDRISASRLEVLALLQSSNNSFWVGTQVGLFAFEKQGAQLVPRKFQGDLHTFSNKSIRVLLRDKQANTWLGTRDGLFQYDSLKRKVTEVMLNTESPESKLGKPTINCIYEDTQGNIWIGVEAGGLAVFDTKKQQVVHLYHKADGLADEDVRGIIEDKFGFIWVSTANGLSRFDRKNERFVNFSKADGLASNRFSLRSVALGLTGNLLFGTAEGLSYFNPAEIGINAQSGKIVFTKLSLLDKEITVDDSTGILSSNLSSFPQLQFTSSQNVFTLQFALLNYINSEKNRYAYKLEGVNTDWITTQIPELTYTNLPAGNYVLWVKGANNDGYWSEPVALHFEILPPFYLTWWAYLLYLMVVSGLTWGIVRYFYVQAKLQREEELHQLKLNFFTNISHEIRTHLTLITVPIDKLIDKNISNSQLITQVLPIKNQANRLKTLVTELLDFRKAESNQFPVHLNRQSIVPLLKEIVSAFNILAEKKNIKFELILPEEELMCCFDSIQMEKVLFNLVSNAFKYTNEQGKINIDVIKYNDNIEIKIIDNGIGISPEYIDKLFENYFQVEDSNIQQTGYGIGLALSKKLIELQNGEISVKSTKKDNTNSTIFTVKIPLICNTKTDTAHTPKQQNTELITNDYTSIDDSNEIEQEIDFEKSDELVLIIEDNDEVRTLLEDIIGQYFKVSTAEDGDKGINKALNELPDLIISDVMMPNKSGLELCHILKNDERSNHIPIILLTAKDKINDELQGLKEGADLYITKPFNKNILLYQIHNLLKSRFALREKHNSQFILAPSPLNLESKDEKFLAKLIAIIELNMDNEIFAVDNLATEIGMSYSVLNKKIKSLTDMSVNDFSKSIRLKRAMQLLQRKEFNISEIAYMVGFSDRKYFSKEFKKVFGKNPSEVLIENEE